jgi:predicted phosphoribosyltransferase
MINDQELEVSQQRIAYFQKLLAQLRITARPDEFQAVSSGYRAETEQMQKEVMEYLSRHSSQTVSAEAS